MQHHRQQPNRLCHPWDSPGKNTGVGCRFLLQCMKVKSESEVAQSCLTLSNPVDCSLPGSSILWIFQARVLEWGAIEEFLLKLYVSTWMSFPCINLPEPIWLNWLFHHTHHIHFCFNDYAKAFDCVGHKKLYIPKEMRVQNHLTCLLRNLHMGQEATVRIGYGTTNWFKIGKGVYQGCILSPCLFNLDAEYIIWNAGLNDSQAGITLLGEITKQP